MSISTPLPPREIIPHLEPGDHLSRDEFERRYEAMPHLKKAELIEGVVYMPSPVRHEQHGSPHLALTGVFMHYWALTPGTSAGDNSTIRLDLNNVSQPDALLMIESRCGGRAQIDQDGYITDAPELVAEVAASSVSMDLNTKLRVYRRSGVREYLVWRVLDQTIDWFVLSQGQFQPLARQLDGTYHSEVFPGLWLDPEALVRLELSRVLQVLQQGIASPEHAAFVAALQQRAQQGTQP